MRGVALYVLVGGVGTLLLVCSMAACGAVGLKQRNQLVSQNAAVIAQTQLSSIAPATSVGASGKRFTDELCELHGVPMFLGKPIVVQGLMRNYEFPHTELFSIGCMIPTTITPPENIPICEVCVMRHSEWSNKLAQIDATLP